MLPTNNNVFKNISEEDLQKTFLACKNNRAPVKMELMSNF
jgi:hypothetical protein